ncbi:4Fe-4S dicluster domain-containing protein [Campylobacter upsaliensis]
MQRRKFLKSLALSPVLVTGANLDFSKIKGKASIIDLDRCDGCTGFDMPKCVSACKEKNAARFPKPVEEIPNYFPRKINEDYSQKQNDISRLSPYNWTFVEAVEVDSKKIFIPRRCMHCDDPTCQKICPFGVISKDKNNAVNIDEHFCFGGAKCRDVCPWGIPQRQAGVGIYLKIAPKLAGGGAMFKCDMCADLLAEGKKPACETQCPKNAIIFDDKAKILNLVEKAKDQGKFIYGDTQNGGTSTFYISSVDFAKIDEAIAKKYENTGQVGRPHMKVKVDNFINEDSTLIKGVLAAPLIGVVAGAIAVAKARKIKKEEL